MAPPQFPIFSPGSDKDGDAAVEPVFGAGREADPGYLAALRTGSLLGQLRLTMLALAAAPVLILAIVPSVVREGPGRLGGHAAWAYLPILGVAALAVLAAPRTPKPMTPGAPPAAAARTAAGRFRQALFVRFALSDAVILTGLPLAVVTHSELPFLLAFALGYPLLLWLALPTTGTVERFRRRLEADGAQSHLWAVLLAPYERPR